MDRRWWRAQAVRYLMRFPTEYTCNLLNEARHAAFGKIAAKMVLESLAEEWPKVNFALFFFLLDTESEEETYMTKLYIYIPMGRMKRGVSLQIYFPFKIIVLIV
ncbi:hypothetical protein E2542_SST11196 [Spatholobus suberectus]|nr:hypothetical protein E2542_SST11196 [Spatholobus suberectus]